MSGALVVTPVTHNPPLSFKKYFFRSIFKISRVCSRASVGGRRKISDSGLIFVMSFAMDKAMMELSLDEEDEPFNMPELPQFKSCERNSRSLIGRILNPECQKMANLIRNMPRK